MIADNFMGVVENSVMALFIAVAIFSLQSCEPDSWDKIYEPEEQVLQEDHTEYVVNVTGMIGEERGTRSILGSDTGENPFIKDSGYQVFAFNRRAGVLEAVAGVDSRTASATLKLNSRDTYDFFVVGNLWFLDSNGKKEGWDTFFEKIDRYPAKAADMADASLMPYYRFDGAALGSTGLRTESFAEVAFYGISYSGKKEGVTYENSRSGVSVPVKKLFSKVTLTVDHSGLVGPSGDVNAFVNESIHLRQVNCRVHPFIEGLAAGAEDIMESAEDYEASPENGSSKTFVFYVPENCGGTYSVSDPSGKNPSAAGTRSGCVTYLEFVGKLDPAKAGGYGGTFTYKFCLGGNATTDYNVVRNSNYKVTLGFKAGSLFDAAYWKLDMGSGLTDTRVLGLSEDAAGSKRLNDDGSQVIAVRPTNGSSNKKELYVFFNHKGEGSNEVTSYVDEYTSGYTPADATRSAVQITFDKNNSDAIRYSYESSTGKLSFWTDSPTALTAGHEYPVTFTLYPGGRTFSAKVRTVAPMEVGFNTGNMLVGMKRTLTTAGFCGGNVSLKVTSGGEDILRYSNSAAADGSAGTDKYVTKAGVTLTGLSVPLYAYKNGSVTLSVSSDDTFNDESVPLVVNVGKPEPRYDRIKENAPIWNSATGTVEYDYRIMLPFDGTPVEVPAYYAADGWSTTPITVGPGENQFDFDVYAQLLDFVFTFTSDCVAKDPNSLKIYLQKLEVLPGSYFETNLLLSDLAELSNLFHKVFANKVKLAPRSAALFPPAENGFEAFLTTLIPGFYDITQKEEGGYRGFKRTAWEKTEIESDYFNFWSNDWSAWTTLDEIKPDVIKAQWPKITNSIGFYLAGCTPSSLNVRSRGTHDDDAAMYVSNEGIRLTLDGEGDMRTFNWKFAPGESDWLIEDTNGGVAPYGKQRLSMKVTNIHSGEVYPPEDVPYDYQGVPESPDFNLKYGFVRLAGYLSCRAGDRYADYMCAAPLTIAAVMLNGMQTTYVGANQTPLYAFGQEHINSGVPFDILPPNPGELYRLYYFSEYGSSVQLEARFPAWISEGADYSRKDSYDGAVWTKALANFCAHDYVAVPKEYHFKDSRYTTRYSTLPKDMYRNEDLPDYISFTFDYAGADNYVRCLGYVFDE